MDEIAAQFKSVANSREEARIARNRSCIYAVKQKNQLVK